jgi:hypothetical protein
MKLWKNFRKTTTIQNEKFRFNQNHNRGRPIFLDYRKDMESTVLQSADVPTSNMSALRRNRLEQGIQDDRCRDYRVDAKGWGYNISTNGHHHMVIVAAILYRSSSHLPKGVLSTPAFLYPNFLHIKLWQPLYMKCIKWRRCLSVCKSSSLKLLSISIEFCTLQPVLRNLCSFIFGLHRSTIFRV